MYTTWMTTQFDPDQIYVRLLLIGLHVRSSAAVAGVIVVAVTDELMTAHPSGHIETATILSPVGGTGLLIAGYVLFRRMTARTLQLSSIAVIAMLAILGLMGSRFSPIQLSLACTLIVVTTAMWQTIRSDDRPVIEREISS
ncbi:MAG: hypothetical protein M3440_09045 [Chloroflexota bacterium]|nr:hypothetical protein [Chloroflexota bacterium]